MSKIYSRLNNMIKNAENDVIIIKGRFIGFDIDNLFEPYSFTDCSIQ